MLPRSAVMVKHGLSTVATGSWGAISGGATVGSAEALAVVGASGWGIGMHSIEKKMVNVFSSFLQETRVSGG